MTKRGEAIRVISVFQQLEVSAAWKVLDRLFVLIENIEVFIGSCFGEMHAYNPY